jgi:hypothetical protein
MMSKGYRNRKNGITVDELQPNYFEFFYDNGSMKKCIAGTPVDLSSFPDLEQKLKKQGMVLIEPNEEDLEAIADAIRYYEDGFGDEFSDMD